MNGVLERIEAELVRSLHERNRRRRRAVAGAVAMAAVAGGGVAVGAAVDFDPLAGRPLDGPMSPDSTVPRAEVAVRDGGGTPWKVTVYRSTDRLLCATAGTPDAAVAASVGCSSGVVVADNLANDGPAVSVGLALSPTAGGGGVVYGAVPADSRAVTVLGPGGDRTAATLSEEAVRIAVRVHADDMQGEGARSADLPEAVLVRAFAAPTRFGAPEPGKGERFVVEVEDEQGRTRSHRLGLSATRPPAR